jgi:hypothetical protein
MNLQLESLETVEAPLSQIEEIVIIIAITGVGVTAITMGAVILT